MQQQILPMGFMAHVEQLRILIEEQKECINTMWRLYEQVQHTDITPRFALEKIGYLSIHDQFEELDETQQHTFFKQSLLKKVINHSKHFFENGYEPLLHAVANMTAKGTIYITKNSTILDLVWQTHLGEFITLTRFMEDIVHNKVLSRQQYYTRLMPYLLRRGSFCIMGKVAACVETDMSFDALCDLLVTYMCELLTIVERVHMYLCSITCLEDPSYETTPF